jgi:drug/metabolite transporter (DMT)-like permease
MIESYGGELAALMTSVLWSATAIFFTKAGQRIGSVMVNRIRLLIALVWLMAFHWFLQGSPLPVAAAPERWFWLGVSGVVGLVLGDSFLFQAYLWLGPRLGMLMMSLAPVLSALLALTFLGEQLSALQWLGIVVAVTGIATVVLDHGGGLTEAGRRRDYARGILFGIGAASGQAIGLVLAKRGLLGDFSSLSGNVIRMLSAAAIMWLVTFLIGRAGATIKTVAKERGSWMPLIGGATTGPFLGVWLSLTAIQLTEVGIASTLMALSPVILLPVGRVLFGERVGWQAIAGTLVAILGVALLFLT